MGDTREHIMSGKAERMKWHYEYDVRDRPIGIYEVIEGAEDGRPCLLTTYTYDGTSTRIVGAKETVSAWDSAWDI